MQGANAAISTAIWNHSSCGVSMEKWTQDFLAMQSLFQLSTNYLLIWVTSHKILVTNA